MSRHNESLKIEIYVVTMIGKFLNHNIAILLALSQQQPSNGSRVCLNNKIMSRHKIQATKRAGKQKMTTM